MTQVKTSTSQDFLGAATAVGGSSAAATEGSAVSAAPAVWRDYLELTKPRLNSLVLITTGVGYLVAVGVNAGQWPPLTLLIHTLFGTALCAGSGSALNQWIEKKSDRLMHRTANRPLPAGRMEPYKALWFGVLLGVLGIADLAIVADRPLAALIAFITLLTYAAMYTPMKRVSSIATLIGAVPGALPPLIGWAAVQNSINAQGLSLFIIMFVWQLPHFLAIAWFYRDEYANAGIPVLPSQDPTGIRTAGSILNWSVILIPATLLPGILGMVGPVYLVSALILGLIQVGLAVRIARHRTPAVARILFFYTIMYLPLLLTIMVIDAVVLAGIPV